MSDEERAWWFTGSRKSGKIFEHRSEMIMPVSGMINRSEGESRDRLKVERPVRKLLKYLGKNSEG